MSTTKLEKVSTRPVAENNANFAEARGESAVKDPREMLAKLREDQLMLNWIKEKGIRNKDVEKSQMELLEAIETLKRLCNV